MLLLRSTHPPSQKGVFPTARPHQQSSLCFKGSLGLPEQMLVGKRHPRNGQGMAEEGGTSAPAGSCFAEHPAPPAAFNAASKAGGASFPESSIHLSGRDGQDGDMEGRHLSKPWLMGLAARVGRGHGIPERDCQQWAHPSPHLPSSPFRNRGGGNKGEN